MATTQYFDEIVKCQGGEQEIEIEFGSSSFYKDPSIYLTVDGKSLVMNREQAKEFVNAAVNVGLYFGFTE